MVGSVRCYPRQRPSDRFAQDRCVTGSGVRVGRSADAPHARNSTGLEASRGPGPRRSAFRLFPRSAPLPPALLSNVVLLPALLLLLAAAGTGGSAVATEYPAPAAPAVQVDELSAWQGRKVASLDLDGMPESLSDQARSGLALTPRKKLLGSKKAILRLSTAEADGERIRLLLARHGWPGARISARAEALGDQEVGVVFVIDPGPEVVYGEVTVAGCPQEVSATADSLSAFLTEQRRLRESQIEAVRERLVSELLQAGYAHPRVEFTLQRPDSLTCDIAFTCYPGGLFNYGRLRVEGVSEDLVPLVHKTVGLDPGTRFSPAIAADARRYVRTLGLFRQVRFTSEASGSATLDLVADLQPRKMHTLEASVGSFTDNWFVVGAGFKHRNLFKRGRGAGLEASYATHRITGESRLWWPALVAPRSRTELLLSYEIQDEDSYRLDKREVELSTLFEPWFNMTYRVGIAVVHSDLENRSEDPDAFTGDVGFQTVLTGAWYLDTSDGPLDPRGGRRLTLRGDWSPEGPWTEAPFASVRGSASQYVSLGGRRVLAARLDAATAWPLKEGAELPPDRRWFAGGVSTMRGYKRHMLGPLDSEGQPLGGQSRLLAGIEARIPVWSILGIALFVDSGQVWTERDGVRLSDLAVAAGGGLMIGTPVGPVRIDVAYGLTDPPPGEPQTVLQLGIGHPY